MSRPHHPNVIEEQRHFDSLPILERCLHCGWVWTGTAIEGRDRALEHRLQAHPEIQPKRRRPGRHLKSFHQPNLTKADWVDINIERSKRARLNGLDLEDQAV